MYCNADCQRIKGRAERTKQFQACKGDVMRKIVQAVKERGMTNNILAVLIMTTMLTVTAVAVVYDLSRFFPG
jgi:ribosomal protein S19E (S16A)